MSRETILTTPQISSAICPWPFCTSCAPWMGFLCPQPPALGCWAWLPMAGVGAVLEGTPKEWSVWGYTQGVSSCPSLWPGGISGLWGGQLVLGVGGHPALQGVGGMNFPGKRY